MKSGATDDQETEQNVLFKELKETGSKATGGSSAGMGWRGRQEPCNTCHRIWT